ncbi:MAG: hypothetical protein NXI00_04640 [Cytophagales bacterium]|nr:hypothetical protein [Cytophagales bacterium]
MIVKKNYSLSQIFKFTGGHLIWISLWVSSVVFLIRYFQLEWLHIPWLPLSIIGTAVAFYIGFKNNQAYDRQWEARKIWGGIVNSSRSWGSSVKVFISYNASPTKESKNHQKRLIHKHIAWLYILRRQLLIPTPWEHVSQHTIVAKTNRRRMKIFGLTEQENENVANRISELLGPELEAKLSSAKNTATQLLDSQSLDLKTLYQEGLIDDFRHIQMQKLINEFYTLQGQCERIKKFPLPRQYGGVSSIFVGIFIFLLPFGMVSEFTQLGLWGITLSIPFTILIAWIYVVMELVGDYSENPFEGLANDIPMLSLTRTIEIDLLEMLGETDLPAPIEARKNILL